MMHLLWSLFFLSLTVVLVLAYILVGLCAVACGCTLVYFAKQYPVFRNRQLAWYETRDWLGAQIQRWRRSKFLLLYLPLLVLSFNISLYLKERVEWMGDDNAHLTAKQYWVAGQVVYGYRLGYCTLPKRSPEALGLRPFTWLQEWIYRKGVRYLPVDDGEIGVWSNVWFVYPYSRRFLWTKDIQAYEPSPRMIALLERSWSSMEHQATRPFADSQMREQYYYRSFPGQALAYRKDKCCLTGKCVGGQKLLVQDPQHIARSRQMVAWLGDLAVRWLRSPETMAFLRQQPKIEAIRQLVRLLEAGDLMRGTIYSREFSCHSPEVRQYLNLRAEFVGDEQKKSALQLMGDRAQANELYDIGINTEINRFLRYAIERYCGDKAAGEEDMKFYASFNSPRERLENSLKNLFDAEVKILEEMHHGQ